MNKQLINKIKNWKEFEQKLRFRAGKEQKKSKEIGVFNYLVYLIDAVNNFRIKELIKNFGYPTSKLIGKVGMQDFWLLIQHQDEDIELQKRCLKHCNFDKNEMEHLTDRILIKENKKQKFNTQFKGKKK